MAKIKLTYKTKLAYRKIKKVLAEYPKVRIVFQELRYNSEELLDSYRRRVITKDGMSKVSYSRHRNPKEFTTYSESCFLAERKIKDLDNTIEEMKKHDLRVKIIPIEIHYGWLFLKREKLYQEKA